MNELTELTGVDDFIARVSKNYKPKEKLAEFSDDDTYALRDLKKAMNAKCFSKYLSFLGIAPNTQHRLALYHYIHRSYDVQSSYVFALREKIQPSKWYLRITEELPGPVSFTPKFTEDVLFEKESVAHIKIREMTNQYGGASALASMYGVEASVLRNAISWRIFKGTEEKRRFRALPQTSIIRAFMKTIHPDLWFIYPEELEGWNQRKNSPILETLDSNVPYLISKKYGFSLAEASRLFSESETRKAIAGKAERLKGVPESAVLEIWEAERIAGSPEKSPRYQLLK